MDSSNQNSHEMTTRSKSKEKETPFYEFDEESDLSEADDISDISDITDISDLSNLSVKNNLSDESDLSDDIDDVDEHGNLKGFIDYKCKAKFDRDEFQKQLSILSRGQTHFSPKKKKKNAFSRPKNKKNKQLNDVILSYLIMKATDKANIELRTRARKKKKRDKIQLDEEISEDNSQDSKGLIVKLKNDLAAKGKEKEKEKEADEDSSDNESFVSAQEVDEYKDVSETSTDISVESDEKSDIG